MQRSFLHHEAKKAARVWVKKKKAYLTEETHKIYLIDYLFWDLLAPSGSHPYSFHLAASWHTTADKSALAHMCTMKVEQNGLPAMNHSD